MPSLSFGICGTTGPDPQYNPSLVLREPKMSSLMAVLNEGPRTPAELAEMGYAAGDVQRAVALKAITDGGERVRIAVPLLTLADAEHIHRALAPLAADLAERLVLGVGPSDARLAAGGFGGTAELVRLAVYGCMGLDWAGLALLDRLGLTHPGNTYPDGGVFTILGQEVSGAPPAGRYCSSHTAQGNEYCFTSFGDNSGRRWGLPDLFWLFERAAWQPQSGLPAELSEGLARVASEQALRLIDEAGEVLARGGGNGGSSGGAVLQLLRQLDYLSEEGLPLLPVMSLRHWCLIEAAMRETISAMREWLKLNHAAVVAAADGTSPARNGVDPRLLFVELWHDLFGETNRTLAAAGWMAEPQAPTPGQARYSVWCAEKALYDRLYAWLREYVI